MLDEAYNDKSVDMVLVLDFAANQVAGLRSDFPKPTFLPNVFNAALLGYPLVNETSGKKNLQYMTGRYDFAEELNVLKTVAPFSKAVLIGEKKVAQGLGQDVLNYIRGQAREAGVDLSFLLHDDDYQKLVPSIPVDVDAVLMASLSSLSNTQKLNLIGEVNKRKLLSFSLIGDAFVREGVFATNSPDTDWERLARRNALNMQSVMLGEKASSLPVFFEHSSRLMINMKTAREIRYAPSFDILSEAILLHEERAMNDRVYSLTDVAQRALDVNLSIATAQLSAGSADAAANQARGALLPQITSSITYNRFKETDNVRSGLAARDTTDGVLRLTQPLYSEKNWANYAIQKYTALSEKEVLKQTELDIVQAAVNSYLDVLRTQTTLAQQRYNLDITRTNLNLAENRVKVGSTNASDLYRWESELANAKNGVLSAKSNLERAKQNLNKLLNRPIDEDFSTSVETLDNPALLISDPKITNLVNNAYTLEVLTDLFVEQGLELSSELKQIEAQIAASKRGVQRDERAYFVPDVNLTGQYSRNFDEDRAAGGTAAEENDWQIGVEFSLPLYEGGARAARTAQSRLAVKQQETQYQDTKNTIETNIRSAMESVHASYAAIDLTKKSEIASQKSYDLVSQSYVQGAVSITDLLDSQTTLISAREASMNAVHTLLIDLMILQRAIGAFDFFLTDSEKLNFSESLLNRVNQINTYKPKDSANDNSAENQ